MKIWNSSKNDIEILWESQTDWDPIDQRLFIIFYRKSWEVRYYFPAQSWVEIPDNEFSQLMGFKVSGELGIMDEEDYWMYDSHSCCMDGCAYPVKPVYRYHEDTSPIGYLGLYTR